MTEQTIHIQIAEGALEGGLVIPLGAKGIVLFAHGSGSSRFSPRNQFVAKLLRQSQLATLLIDLLTAEEEIVDSQTRQWRFDINLLAERLLRVTHWLQKDAKTRQLNIGYFGSSTGAAAALVAAAEEGESIKAVVSRGGRPDLAGKLLKHVQAPTLLIVGGHDFGVIELNQTAFNALNCEKKLEIVPSATHLFEEPGTLEQVGRLAAQWFSNYLSS